jgi:hypothetical protein
MSNVTTQDLELETAELLPGRETLWSHSCGCYGHSGTTTVVAGNGNGDGNFDGGGLIGGIGDGDLDGNTLVVNL